MKYMIHLAGRAVPYDLSRRATKNLTARVRPNGSLAVSAPPGCRMREITDFLSANSAAILHAMDAALEREAAARLPMVEGTCVPIWGIPVSLHLAHGKRTQAILCGDVLQLILKDGANEMRYQTLLSSYLEQEAKKEICNTCREIYNKFYADCFPYPTVSFRRMVARWGSCCQAKGQICFNLRLIYAPRQALAYVVLHELTHMLHPNHSPAFYAALAERMPDYRTHAAALKGIDLRHLPWI